MLPFAIALGAALAAAPAIDTAATDTRRVEPAVNLLPTEDFSAAEPGEALQGGTATSRKTAAGRNAFSHPSGNLDLDRKSVV